MASNHIGPHKYQKMKNKTGTLRRFKCALPGCTHFLDERIIIGRAAKCFRCGETFTVYPKALLIKNLHCLGCTKTRAAKIEGVDNLLETLLLIPSSEFESKDV